MSAKDYIATQTCELSKEELNDFLTLYPIPSGYHLILPKSNQIIFDAPLRFIYPGLTLLVVPSLPLLLSCVRFIVVSPLSTTFEGSSICGWHEQFLCVQDSIIPAKYSQLLSEQYKLYSKLFKDKLPLNIKDNPMFASFGRYPMSVRVFLDPILFLVGLKPSWEHGQQRPMIMAGGKADEELVIQPTEFTTDSKESSKPELFVVHSGSVATWIKDRMCKTRGGLSRPHVKRKLALGSLTSCATRAKTSSLKDNVPFLTVSDDDKETINKDTNMAEPNDYITATRKNFISNDNKGRMVKKYIDGFCNGGELPEMVRVGSMTYFKDHKWYDEQVNGKTIEETLALKAKV
uniref:Uncharacterized protein n=1 Tax=Tanacetum cinerariifolium TaxID=118510 RepID=A0A6L2N1V3_TANCI|nr:hypothetical protein [Tanacetum cinerariifolium]